MPGLAFSASSGSSPSSSGSRHRSNLRTSLNQNGTADSQIFRGAEILRRQIVESSFRNDKDIMNLHHRSSEQNELVMTMEEIHDKSEGSDWSDPRSPPVSGTFGQSRKGVTFAAAWSPEQMQDQSPYVFPETGDANHWAQYVSSDDEAEDGKVDDTTADLLLRATGSLTETSSSLLARDPHSPSSIQDTQNHLLFEKVYGTNTKPSTFDSSFSELFPRINCGSSYFPNDFAHSCDMRQAPCTNEPLSATTRTDSACHQDSWELLRDLQQNEKVLLLKEHFKTQKSKSENLKVNSHPIYTEPRRSWQHPVESNDDQPPRNEQMKHQGNQNKRPTPNLSLLAPPRRIVGPDPSNNVVPPRSIEYCSLLRNPGFCHAQQAGILWQSLVSQHVRFPSQWWNGSRTPPMGVGTGKPWTHVGRHRVRENPFLQQLVPSRGSAGRLLLHVIIRDDRTAEPFMDLAIGCFHPNARGVRTSFRYDPSVQSCRDFWLAFRNRSERVSLIDSLLLHEKTAEESPLGGKHAVDNNNMRAVFGEMPPVHTIFTLESELYAILSLRRDGWLPPAAILLERYVPEW